jgi:hypothetical protein
MTCPPTVYLSLPPFAGTVNDIRKRHANRKAKETIRPGERW